MVRAVMTQKDKNVPKRDFQGGRAEKPGKMFTDYSIMRIVFPGRFLYNGL